MPHPAVSTMDTSVKRSGEKEEVMSKVVLTYQKENGKVPTD